MAKQRNHFFQSILTIKNYKNAQRSCFKTLFGLRYLERERVEEETFSVVKLGLELDPVQPEAVEEGRQAFHHAQDADRQERPEGEDGEHDEGAVPGKVPVVTISAARWPMFSRCNAILKPPKLTYFVTLEAAGVEINFSWYYNQVTCYSMKLLVLYRDL